jgi:hypothetical protein
VNFAFEAELIRPLPAQTDDQNTWVEGWCWLWCGFQYTSVLFIGATSTAGAHAPLFACGPCIAQLHDSVWDYAEAQHYLPEDRQGLAVPLYAPPAPSRHPLRYRRGRHRRPRTPLGERFYRAITGLSDSGPIDPPLPVAQEPTPAPPRAEASRQGAGSHTIRYHAPSR